MEGEAEMSDPINRSDILAALRQTRGQGATTEEIGDSIGVPNEANARRRLYHALTRMVAKKQITKKPMGKRLWRFYSL